jgi:general secretion pathway protein I
LRRARAFTLLEVMVAVAILGLALTVILSAQAGLYSGAAFAEHTSIAVGLARCRMTELEEYLLKFGFPVADQKDDGPCCEDDSSPNMRCTWQIDTVKLPDPKPPSLSSSGSLNFGSGVSANLGSTGAPGAGGPLDLSSGSTGPLGALGRLATNPQSMTGDAGVSGFASALKENTGGVDAIAQLVMALVYPRLKPMLEASIRKITVKVNWREGIRERDLTIVQYVTHPTRPDLLAPAGSASGAVPGAFGPTTGAAGGSILTPGAGR